MAFVGRICIDCLNKLSIIHSARPPLGHFRPDQLPHAMALPLLDPIHSFNMDRLGVHILSSDSLLAMGDHRVCNVPVRVSR